MIGFIIGFFFGGVAIGICFSLLCANNISKYQKEIFRLKSENYRLNRMI